MAKDCVWAQDRGFQRPREQDEEAGGSGEAAPGRERRIHRNIRSRSRPMYRFTSYRSPESYGARQNGISGLIHYYSEISHSIFIHSINEFSNRPILS